MGSMNRVFLMGRLTRDPEVRKTPAGSAVSDIGVAVSEKTKDKNGKEVETTCFADVVVWGRTAETCGEYLRKGSPVLVEGRLQTDQWKSNDGKSHSRLRIRGDRVQFLGGAKSGEGATRSGQGVAAAVEETADALSF